LQGSPAKSDGVRSAARAVSRKILEQRNAGRIHHDFERLVARGTDPRSLVTTQGGGYLAWEPKGVPLPPYADPSGDNVILAGARRVADLARAGGAGHRVVVISEDSNMLLKCDALGLAAENLRYGKLDLDDPESVYRGWERVEVAAQVVQDFLAGGEGGGRAVALEALPREVAERLVWNTGVELVAGDVSVLLRCNAAAGRLEELRFAQYWDRKRSAYRPRAILGLTPRDPLQIFALEFLLDPEVQLVVLDGPAGSGKTRLMVAAALYLLVGQPTSLRVSGARSSLIPDTQFGQGLVLVRPEHPSSQYDLGYLPGDYQSKLSPWLEPFFQHMRSLSAANEHDFVADLEQKGMLAMLSTSMLRGLDIERSIVLADEMQNGDRHLAKTLMSRFCETSKVVLAGCLDPVQIDNPYVDWRSSALTRVKQAYRGFGPFVAQVSLRHNYRGPISRKADEL
jgi:PhoH-like ATPase